MEWTTLIKTEKCIDGIDSEHKSIDRDLGRVKTAKVLIFFSVNKNQNWYWTFFDLMHIFYSSTFLCKGHQLQQFKPNGMGDID